MTALPVPAGGGAAVGPGTYAGWIAALNAEARRRGDTTTQPPDVMNPFYDDFPVSPQNDDWRVHFEKGHTPAAALDAEWYIEWHRLPDPGPPRLIARLRHRLRSVLDVVLLKVQE